MISSSPRAQESDGAPATDASGWDGAKPADVGLDPQALRQMAETFAHCGEANVHAILVARQGKLAFEQYYSGEDTEWGKPAAKVDFGPDVPHDLRSISKSVVALTVGIGLEQGWIRDIDAPVFSLLPAYADLWTPEKDRITLRHLLTMSPGLAWNEEVPYSDPANSEVRMSRAPDPCRVVLSQPVSHDPGLVWTYNGGTTALMAGILQAATGKTIDQVVHENLFLPLGIRYAHWARLPGSGLPAAASGLRLRPLDTLKLGQLVLSRGLWRNQRIVPEAWIETATAPHMNAPGAMFYGFQFWLGRSLVNGREVDWVAGMGYGGQRLFIVPSLDLVVLVHAGIYASAAQDWVGATVLNRFVLPAAQR
ncbi:serine hydrolase domain-containing protein [Methylovirgula sp. 4M-Z18]|uniref:serine hydrolase domain-containing protein n=1 Tax=Methylovirgula sp. 4M-Z18 TaxID=2293567 RepID=UPI0013140645|nr:serine hydrolase [Methylovirgula sp. 4M-Z18]